MDEVAAALRKLKRQSPRLIRASSRNGTGCTNVDIGVNANLELLDKFCYLGDMLSVDGDDDAAVENRI